MDVSRRQLTIVGSLAVFGALVCGCVPQRDTAVIATPTEPWARDRNAAATTALDGGSSPPAAVDPVLLSDSQLAQQGAGVPLGSAWKSRLASPAEPAGCGMAPCPRTHPTYSRPATAQNGCLSAWIRATGPSWAQPDCRPLGPAGPLAALTDIEAALR